MRIVGIWTLLILVGLALGPTINSSHVGAQVTGAPKFGFVDTDRIFSEVNVIKEKRQELIKARQRAEDELAKKISEWNEKRRKLETQREFLQPDAYNEQKTSLDTEYVALRASKREEEARLSELFKETIGPVRTQVNEVVEKIAKEEGYAFIFMKEFLAYGAAQYDITQKVVDRLNK